MANITLLPSAKVPLVYDGENTMTTEWYRFFFNIYGFTGTGVVPVNKGGTGLDTIGDHQIIIGNANNVFEPAVFTGSGINITYSPGIVNLAIGASGVTPGTYGSASQVGVFTVNQYGNITAASNTSIGIDANQIVSGTLAVVRGGTGQSTYTDGQLLIGNTTGNTLTKATLTASTGINITNGAGSITIANTGVLSVSGTAPVVSSGGATPAISMAAANTTTNGYLTSTDWNTFNNKAPATSGTSILYGNGSGGFSNVTIGSGISFAGGTLSATGSGGTVTAVTGVAPIASSGGTTPAISISQATTSTNGYLSSTDWNTFNSKQPAGTYVTSISIASSNGFTGTSSGGATPALTLATSVTGILKGNGTAISAATSGTDYAPATSGTSILYGNGAGGFSNVTIGTGVSFAGGTLSATGSGGTVTSVSGTGTVNGITLTGTVTSSGSLTLGGTLGGIGNSQLTNSTISGVALGGNLFNLTAGTGVSFSTGTTYNGSAAITINATGTGGTVTSVAALTLGTTGTDLSSTVANSTTTPVITLNVPTASAANRGALSAADWSTFNSKAPGVTFTTGYVPYGQGTTTLNQSANLFFDGTNLGVGTNSPSSYGKLAVIGTVAGNVTGVVRNLDTNAASQATFAVQKNADVLRMTTLYGIGIIGSQSNMPIYFETNSANRMQIFTSGGVSIGNTTDPGATNLSVTGTGKFGTTVGVGAATPSTSGAGITFPATQSASTDANTLDDYEEGTWTPTLFGFVEVVGAGSITTTGTYTKIGRLVEINCSIICAGGATISGVAAVGSYITGLPFTPAISSGGTWENATSFAAFGGVLILGGTASLFLTTGWAAQSATFVFEAKYTV